jgi:hypothetical protein
MRGYESWYETVNSGGYKGLIDSGMYSLGFFFTDSIELRKWVQATNPVIIIIRPTKIFLAVLILIPVSLVFDL